MREALVKCVWGEKEERGEGQLTAEKVFAKALAVRTAKGWRRIKRGAGWLGMLLVLPSCVTTGVDLKVARREFGVGEATRNGLWHCSGHGCRHKQFLSFTEEEWREIQAVFGTKGPGESGAGERRRIRRTVAVIEEIVGHKTGTHRDVGGSFAGVGKSGQMDCVDEMLNVATYLSLLIEEGLVTEHKLGKRYTNHLFKTGAWPHTATSIIETATGREYVVDSWWLRNGSLPYVVPLEQWSEGEWNRPTSKGKRKAAEATVTPSA